MKNFSKLFALTFCALPLLTGCEALQGSLSSTQNALLAEETGSPSYGYKVWYYNGTSSTDMTSVLDNEFYAESLKIDFGRKVSVGSLNGSITVNYTDAEGNSHSDVTKDIRGNLSPDYSSFYLDMTSVVKVFDGENIPGGNASVDIKLSGFICAEGRQNGRKVSVFELNKLQVKPLFTATDYSLSTGGFESAKYPVVLNTDVSLEDQSVTGLDSTGNEYEFALSCDDSVLYLEPKFAKPADNTEVTLPLTGIIPLGSGSAYEKDLTLTFTKHLISIDGVLDANYTGEKAVYADDPSGDSVTNGYEGDGDLTGIYVTNDEDYLYVAITGALTVAWYDGLTVMISKDHTFDASSASGSGKEGYDFVSSKNFGRETLKNGKPDFYLFDRIYFTTLKAWVENSSSNPLAAEEVTGILSSGISGGTFIEYAVPMTELSKAGIVSGNKVHVLAGFSAHWDDGVYLSDVCPDDAVNFNDTHSSATVNFQNALEFTLN